MKKNKSLRLASVLLMLCLITTCAVSGTFAKYTTSASSFDTAHVAKWDMSIVVNAAKDFAPNLDDVVGDDGVAIKASDAVTNKLAPGSQGTMFVATIKGQPEVIYNVTINFTLTLSDWVVDANDYCPVVFTVNSETYSLTDMGGTHESATVADLKVAVENAVVQALQTGNTVNYTANDTHFAAGKEVTLSWAWAFRTGADETAKAANDIKDTALGDADTLATIGYNLGIVINQLDK